MSVAVAVVDAVERYLRSTRKPRPAVAKAEVPGIAADLARERRSPTGPMEGCEQTKSVIVVHGHNYKGHAEREHVLESVEGEAVVLSRRSESAQSRFQNFMALRSKRDSRSSCLVRTSAAPGGDITRRRVLESEPFDTARVKTFYLNLVSFMVAWDGKMSSLCTRTQTRSSRTSSDLQAWTA